MSKSNRGLVIRFYPKYVEVWNSEFLQKVIHTNEVHGDVFTDGVFGCHTFIGNELL